MEDIITYSQKNDIDAIEELIKRIQKNVYATIYYLDPKPQNVLDLTQEVLFRVSKNIKNLKNPKLFNAWLNQIITNIFYDHIRKKNRQIPTISLDNNLPESKMTNPTIDIPDIRPKPLDITLGLELEDLIEQSIHKLPDNFRLALVLREFQGLSYEQIAQLTDVNIGTVKSRIARARNKLQEDLKPYIA